MVVSERIGISIIIVSARFSPNILLEYPNTEEEEEEEEVVVVERSFLRSFV